MRILLLTLFLFGCEGQMDVNLPTINQDGYYYNVFDGNLDGQTVAFDKMFYECREPELFVYKLSTGAAVLNTDSTQVSCHPLIYSKFISVQSMTRVITP